MNWPGLTPAFNFPCNKARLIWQLMIDERRAAAKVGLLGAEEVCLE